MSVDTATAGTERDRKAEHIELALDRRTQLDRHFFDAWEFEHNAAPEIDRAAVDVSTHFLRKPLTAPLLISCMTGGTEVASRINRNLAIAAEETGIAVGVGSQRKALEDSSTSDSFEMRDAAPSVPILANLGAVQLNYGYGYDECRRAVEMVGADALVFHLNAVQEAIQPEGQCDFSDLLPRMGEIARELAQRDEVPVIAKEVGNGISGAVAQRLADHGIRIIDTAGLGGTSWSRIEAARADDVELGELFAHWGVPTPRSIRECAAVPGMTVIGSGGVRNGVDVAKAIALGADLVGMAYPFLVAAVESPERVVEKVHRTIQELEIAMFCLGVPSLAELKSTPIRKRSQG